MIGPPSSPVNLSSASDTETSSVTAAAAAAAETGQTCCCDSCNERRFVCPCFTVYMLSKLLVLKIFA